MSATTTTPLVIAETKIGLRFHRATCRYAPKASFDPAVATPEQIGRAQRATCCSPSEAAVAAARAAHGGHAASIPAVTQSEPGRGELAGGDVQALPQGGKPRTRTANRHDQRDVQARGVEAAAKAAEFVRTALAERDPAGRRDSDHVPAPTPTPAADEPKIGEAEKGAETQTCAGACGKDLPLRRFPTVHRKDGVGRGTECRKCRDARRSASKADGLDRPAPDGDAS